MKIAHIMTRFSPEEHPGGVERVVEELAKRQSQDHDVEVICRNQFRDPEEEEREGFRVRRAPCFSSSGLRTLSSIYTMRKLVRESDADIYHIHDWSPYLNYYLSGSPGKSVLTLHNLTRGLNTWFEGRASRDSDGVACVSEWLSDRIRNRHGVKTETVNDGVDLEKFENGDSEGYVLFVGSLIEDKGIKETCRVFKDRDRELKVVGTGPLREELERDYRHEFLGRVPEKKLVELYSRCEYFVLPSRREGFGLVWGEALASGKPVIATETGVGASLPGGCGEVLPVDYSKDDLEDAVNRIEERDFNPVRLRNFAEENFAWDHVNDKYLELYRDLR